MQLEAMSMPSKSRCCSKCFKRKQRDLDFEDLGGAEYKKFNIYNSHISKFFILEMMLLTVSPLPGVFWSLKFEYFADEDRRTVVVEECYSHYVLAFMFLRVYFVVKWILNQSFYTDAFSKKLCNEYGFYPGFRFVFKSKFIKSPERAIITLFVVTVGILSYITRIFEIYYSLHPETETYYNRDAEYMDMVYFIIVTLTTVGYGDV